MTIEAYPVKPGDWVINKDIPDQIAKIKDVYRNGEDTLVDLVIFSHNGDKIGRESPHMGGPRTYEPACTLSDWQRIKKPNFPIPIVWVPKEDGTHVLTREPQTHLADREWEDKRKGRVYAPTKKSDFDPESEASALRLAAQFIHDTGRELGLTELTDKAAKLEKEAEQISKPMI